MAALIVTAVLAVLAFLILVVSQRAVRRESELLGRRVSAVYVQAANVLRGIRELTVANGRATAVRGVESVRVEMVEAQRRVLILSEGPRLVLEVTLYASVLVALFLSLQSSDPSDTLPLIALYVVAAMRLVPGVARMLGIATQVRSSIEIGLTVLGELHELEDIGERHVSPAGDLPDTGDLVLDGVSFEYIEGVDVLSEITLEVPHGEMVGIVGPSGSGKTTLVSVMLGLLPPTRGRVTFGGEGIGTADPSWMSGSSPTSPRTSTSPTRRSARTWRSGMTNPTMPGSGARWRAPTSTGSSGTFRRASTPASTKAVHVSRSASGNASASPVRCTAVRRCCCSTSRRQHSTASPRVR